MIKLGFNVAPLRNDNKYRGIGTNTKYLLEELKKINDLEIREFLEEKELPSDIDIVHYPFFSFIKRSLPLKKRFPTVVTIHDIIPLLFPEHYPLGVKAKIGLTLQKIALRDVTSVLTISESSKKDLVEYFKIDPKIIHSIYLAPAPEFKVVNKESLPEVRKRYNLPDKFAIYWGGVNWNKNILNLTKACIDEDLDLVLVGKGFSNRDNLKHPELSSFKEFLEKYESHPKVHILGFVETEDLVKIINLAYLTLFVSYYEGFGLPILESQLCGTPVVTSKTSSMPEIGGNGAIYVDPYHISSIREGMQSLYKDTIREMIIKNGFTNNERFSWSNTAKETYKVYEEILSLKQDV